MKSLLSLILLFLSFSVVAQMQQTLKGRIVDRQTQTPLMGATIFIIEHPSLGGVTDMDGYYRIENVPVGRISIRYNYLGYNEIGLSNVNISSSKELVLDIEMEEMVIKGQEVVIQVDKKKALNDRTTNSARTFSVEETQRYAGSLNDVSRMAANFAGINSGSDASNDVIIRGNSPAGLLWRLEGVDIPNPNHFSQAGASGGPIGMLNNNTLSNSDFLTGAFPSEYGNALSGAFDLSMRNGNNETMEMMGQVGFNGFELGAEGPISKKHRSSYLVNVRYSTLEVLHRMGMEFGTGDAIPKYSDISFKLNFPSKKIGRFEIFGLGGLSSIEFIESTKDAPDTTSGENYYADGEQDIYSFSNTGVIGLKHTFIINKSLYSKVSFALTDFKNSNILDDVDTDTRATSPDFRGHFRNSKIFGSIFINKKLNAKHSFRIGSFVTRNSFFVSDTTFYGPNNTPLVLADFDGFTYLMQPYLNWQWKLNDKWVLNTGVHSMYLTLNDKSSIEPRFGMKYQMNENNAFSLAYGRHSQMTNIKNYFSTSRDVNGDLVRPNENLDFTKAHHYVLGYDHNFNNSLRLKLEAYVQDISDAVVDVNSNSFSMMNAGSFTFYLPDSLRNGGAGRNYGLELTFEKFLDKGFYYLYTLSLYESKYKGSDGVERNTAFNGNYVNNFLLGKEFELKSTDDIRMMLVTDFRSAWSGGQRYIPADKEATELAGQLIYDYDNAYNDKFADYIRFDARVAFRMESKKIAQEWAFDVQNFTDRRNIQAIRFDQQSGEIGYIYQRSIFPMFQYKIEF